MTKKLSDINQSQLAFKILVNCIDKTTPSELVKKMGKSKHTISKYLKYLLEENLVKYRKSGKKRIYRVNKEAVVKKWKEIYVNDLNKEIKITNFFIQQIEKNPSKFSKKILQNEKKHIKKLKKGISFVEKITKNEVFKDFITELLGWSKVGHFKISSLEMFVGYFKGMLREIEDRLPEKKELKTEEAKELCNELKKLKKYSYFETTFGNIGFRPSIKNIDKKYYKESEK